MKRIVVNCEYSNTLNEIDTQAENFWGFIAIIENNFNGEEHYYFCQFITDRVVAVCNNQDLTGCLSEDCDKKMKVIEIDKTKGGGLWAKHIRD